jgi:integrase/recombinase XerD
MWLHGRPETTERAYRRHVRRFLAQARKPLSRVTVGNVQAFADSMAHLAPRSRNQGLSAVKSLLTYGQRIGYLTFNVGAVVRLEKFGNDLAQHILSEDAVQKMLHTKNSPRDRAMLRLLYGGGLRASELVRLKWRDLQEREGGGQVTVFGKGGKTRHVLLSDATWGELVRMKNGGNPDSPVFPSRKGGGHLDASAAWRVVRKAAAQAGIEGDVSPHWLRHAHASHALERGAPVALVRDTLGHSSVSTTNGYLHARPKDSSARYLAV